MSSFAQDYLILVFLVCTGALQVAASYSRLKGILLFRHRGASGLFGLLLLVAAFVWFYASRERNLPDTGEGLSGTDQAGFFVVGMALALAFTLLLSSLVNAGKRPPSFREEEGLDALRETTYLNALRGSLSQQWRRWSRLTKR